MRSYKKAMFRIAITGTLAAASLAMGLAPEASAGCPNVPGLKAGAFRPISWQRTGEFGRASPLLVADHDNSVDGIVGLWRVTYAAADGTVFDEGLQQWHSDGTEFHWDVGTPPAASNFCLGVWKKTGRFHYTLNHFFLGWDATTNSLHHRGQIREEIDLAGAGNEHFGTVTVDGYDPAGKPLFHQQGTVHAIRITVKTDLQDLF